ncbi:MAG: cysteine desulfurase family protein [Candidatus Paceibacterota bacterium]
MKHLTPIYFDHAATTQVAPEVLEAMLPYFGKEYGNPSSMYASGRKARAVMERERKNIATILGSEAEEILFTGSGTESDNMAILGIARANRSYGNHILVSSIEHKAVLEAAKQLSKEGFLIEYIPVNKEGLIDVEDCMARITDATILISVMYANNEIGTIQPIKELGRRIQEVRSRKQETPNEERRTKNDACPIFHTDACQAAGHLSLDVRTLGVDCMTINGSKIYGPKGVGVLYKRNSVPIEPIIFGGGQERALRSGTENLPSIVGMSYALTRVEKRREEESKRLIALRDYCMSELVCILPDVVINGSCTSRLPNNIHISVPFVEGESMVLMLDEEGIEASTGSACSASDLQVSHVLTAINQDTSLMHGSLRFSFGEATTKEECDYLLTVLPGIIKRLRSMSPLTISL